ncbi:MAG: two component, sigma54 specific, transcriptional regulator, Fis family [Deltaproteobacteria bacterium]|nr:two component, sigma54 specific, transcriptional regulator, Fis family [Deltaproteobacteria bacterium]
MEAGIQPIRFETSAEVLYPLDRKSKAYMLFQKVQGAMNHVPNFGETCKAILDAVIDEMDAENCSLMLKDPISGYLGVCAARGKNEKRSIYYSDSSGNGKRFKSGEGIAGWVLKEGQALMLNDVRNEPRFVNLNGLNNRVSSLICSPIREKDQVVGVFNLSHSRKGAFNEGDRLALSYISNQVGAALTSARFFLEIKEVNRLRRDAKEVFSKEKVVPIAPLSSSTFVEVGEVTRDEGIFICASDPMHRIREIIDQIANTDVTVLIQGESGVGKEVVARSIHLNSFRKEKPFVKVNCAALPQELLESELFGYEKGAFTGAYRQKPGKFELADGGTIFLDEISEMSLSLQGKLLQVLQDREFSRLGGKKDLRVDVRVLVATNKNIEEGVKEARFREDLYYRLNVVNITIPPLRERKEEIPIFVEYFLEKYGKKYQRRVSPLSDELIKVFSQHHWSGNVRELENVIQRFVVLGNEKAIVEELSPVTTIDSIPAKKTKIVPTKKSWPSLKEVHRDAIKKAESEIILKALETTNWNRKKAANILEINYKTLLYKIKECGLDRRFIP